MKKILIVITLISGIVCHVYGQWNTTYGVNTAASSWGSYNSHFGFGSGYFSYSGHHNTGIGYNALINGGNENTAVGADAMKSGHGGTAVGYQAMKSNCAYCGYDPDAAGLYNTGVGYRSLESNSEGDYNTAVGSEALFSNTASQNVAIGSYALRSNTNGTQNTSTGYNALRVNTTGAYNTASGSFSLYANNAGDRNTANGYYSLYSNMSGHYNTASGVRALFSNISGNYNTAIGYYAGPAAGPALSNTTALGYLAVPTASNQVRLGNTSVTSIGGQVEWTAFSDGRFKKDIREDVSGLEFIKKLKPVSYTVDKVGLNKFLHVNDSSSNQAEAKSIPMRQTGFIAQEVEALVKKTGYVFDGIDVPKNENDPYGIRYAAFVVPLVKAVQELSTKLEEEQKQNKEQKSQIQLLLAQLDSKNGTGNIGVSGIENAFLLQNNPNPFTSETEIKMTVPESVGQATIMIYTLEGKQMKNIQVKNRGEVAVKLLGNELSAGMYLYALIADGKVVDTKRMILTQ